MRNLSLMANKMLDTNNTSDLRLSGKLDFVVKSNKRQGAMVQGPSRLRSVSNKHKSILPRIPACYLPPECSTSWAFLLPLTCRTQVRRYTRNSANREKLYTDECFMNHGTVALCKRLLETGKWLTLAIGSRYERLIIELHRSANNSIPGGYMVNRKGVGQPLRGSCTSNKKGIYEIH